MGAYVDQIKTRRTEVQRMHNEAKTLEADLRQKQEKGQTLPEADVTKLNTLIDEGTVKRRDLERLIELDATDDLLNAPDGQKEVRSSLSRDLALARPDKKSWGQKVIESKQFKATDGKNVGPVEVRVAAVQSNTSDAQGGYLVQPQRLTEIFDLARMRPTSLLNLVNQSETSVDSVEFIRLVSRTMGAAIVPELSSGNGGLKPQVDFQFDLQTAPVKTIAAWVAATRQILMDAPRLRDTIDSELIYQLAYILEDQIINGDGTGNNFLGIVNTPGIQLRAMHATTPVGRGQTTTDSKALTIRRAITDIVLAFYEVDGIAMNPVTSEAIEIAEYVDNKFMTVFDPVTLRLWRKPVIETQVIGAGTALVGNWKLGATFWDRMQTEIRVSENVNDDFIRNMVRVLAELRAAFAVIRPQAFEKVTLI